MTAHRCCGASPLVAGLQEVSMIYCGTLFFTTTKAWLLHSTSPSTFPSVKFVMFIFPLNSLFSVTVVTAHLVAMDDYSPCMHVVLLSFKPNNPAQPPLGESKIMK